MDNDLKQFFDDWKKADQSHKAPEFPTSKRSLSTWWYAAAAVLVLGISIFMLLQETPRNNSQIARDSTQTEMPGVETESTDIYDWESPTGSLASDF